MKKVICFAVTAVIMLSACFSLFGCAQRTKKYSDTHFDLFDSFAQITVYTDSDESFEEYNSLFLSTLEKYHQLLDIYNEYDGVVNLYNVNRSAHVAPVAVSDELFEFLSYAKEIHSTTQGYTSISMGAVTAIWKSAIADKTPPSKDSLDEAALHTEIESLLLNFEDKTVFISDGSMTLDAGALGKGYVADIIYDSLTKAGAESFLLNVGGTLKAHGEKPDGAEWRGGIEFPEGIDKQDISINISEQALSTSGSYHRGFELDGIRYHHIINPFTQNCENYYLSVSVICPSAADADAFSTALFSMSLEQGQAFIEGIENAEVVWILSDGSTVRSEGMK